MSPRSVSPRLRRTTGPAGPRRLTAPQPALGGVAARRGGDDQQAVAGPQPGVADPARSPSRRAAPASPPRRRGSRSSSMCTPASREPAGSSSCSRSACIRSSGAVSTRSSVGSAGRGDPEPPARPAASVPPCSSGEDHDQHEDHVEQPGRAGDRSATAGSSPARSAPRRAGRPRTGTPDRATAAGTAAHTSHRQRPGEQQQHEPDQQRRQHRAGQPGRRGEQAEQHEQADLGQPAPARRRSRGSAWRCGSRALPSTTPATYTARKPEACATEPTAYASTVSPTAASG